MLSDAEIQQMIAAQSTNDIIKLLREAQKRQEIEDLLKPGTIDKLVVTRFLDILWNQLQQDEPLDSVIDSSCDTITQFREETGC